MTFAEFRTAVLANAFPDGYSSRMSTVFSNRIRDCLIELQRYIPSLQTAQREEIHQDATFFSCGTSAFVAPPGKIQSFETQLECDACDTVRAVPYTPCEFRKMLEERGRKSYNTPAGTCSPCDYGDTDCLESRHEPYPYYDVGGVYFAYPDLPLGLKYATNHIDKEVRSKQRAFALYDGYVWTWPVLNSNEVGILRWHGVKKNWKDGDEMPWKDEAGEDLREIQEIVELFVGWKSKLMDDCDTQGASVLKALYDSKFADFLVEQRHLNLLPSTSDCFQ